MSERLLGEEEREINSGPIWATAVVSLVVVSALFFAGPLLLASFLEGVLGSHLLVVLVGAAYLARAKRKREAAP